MDLVAHETTGRKCVSTFSDVRRVRNGFQRRPSTYNASEFFLEYWLALKELIVRDIPSYSMICI